MNMTTFLHNRL